MMFDPMIPQADGDGKGVYSDIYPAFQIQQPNPPSTKQ